MRLPAVLGSSGHSIWPRTSVTLGAMVVAELLKWQAPAVLMLLLVMLSQNAKLAVPENQLPNQFVETFAGDAAVTLAMWDRGLIGSCHDVRYTSLMDIASDHGFLLLGRIYYVSRRIPFAKDIAVFFLGVCVCRNLFHDFLRLVCREIWNTAPGGICLFGICCNSFTRMWLSILKRQLLQRSAYVKKAYSDIMSLYLYIYICVCVSTAEPS